MAAVETNVSADRALLLIRVGWSVAELRGRTRLGGGSDPGRFLAPLPERQDHALPLAQERSPLERLNEVRRVFTTVCDNAGLNTIPATGILDGGGNQPSSADLSGCQRVEDLSNAVPSDPGDPRWPAAWNAFAEALYQFDERIQDQLAAGPFGESSSYQLGRGLAETSWSLNPEAREGAFMSWEYLLGPERTLALTAAVDRLTPFAITTQVAQSVKGSLAAWQRLVADPNAGMRQDTSAVVRLRQQCELWRDLLLSGADPEAIVRPKASLARVSTIGPLMRMLAPQIAVGAVSTALLGASAWFLTSHRPTDGPLGAIVAALSVLGITASTASGRAKASANDTLNRLRTALAADLLVAQATILPDSAAQPHRGRFGERVSVKRPGEIAEPVSVAALFGRSPQQPTGPPAAVAVTPQQNGDKPDDLAETAEAVGEPVGG